MYMQDELMFSRVVFFQVYVIITSAPGAFNCQALSAFTDAPFSICTMVYTFIFSLYFECCYMYVNLNVILILLSVIELPILSLYILS